MSLPINNVLTCKKHIIVEYQGQLYIIYTSSLVSRALQPPLTLLIVQEYSPSVTIIADNCHALVRGEGVPADPEVFKAHLVVDATFGGVHPLCCNIVADPSDITITIIATVCRPYLSGDKCLVLEIQSNFSKWYLGFVLALPYLELAC